MWCSNGVWQLEGIQVSRLLLLHSHLPHAESMKSHVQFLVGEPVDAITNQSRSPAPEG